MANLRREPGSGMATIRVMETCFHGRPMSEGWQEPLVPFVESADKGQYPSRTAVGVRRSDKHVGWEKGAEDLIVRMTGEPKAEVVSCLDLNPPFERLVGKAAFRAGIEAMLVRATAHPTDEPSGCLGYYLSRLEPRAVLPGRLAGSRQPGMSYWQAKDRFLEAIALTVCRQAAIIDPYGFDPQMLIQFLREGNYWQHECGAQNCLAVRMTVPLLIALDRYLDAVMAGNSGLIDALAPWLRIFARFLPIGRLAERRETWLFYDPMGS